MSRGTAPGRGGLNLRPWLLVLALAALPVLACDSAVPNSGAPPASGPLAPGVPQGARGLAAPMDVRGPEIWSVGGARVDVRSSYYIVMPGATGPELMFVAEIGGLPPSVTAGMDQTRADAFALPILQHVVANGLDQRTRIAPAGAGPEAALPVMWVGAAVMIAEGTFSNSGIRTRQLRSSLLSRPEGP